MMPLRVACYRAVLVEDNSSAGKENTLEYTNSQAFFTGGACHHHTHTHTHTHTPSAAPSTPTFTLLTQSCNINHNHIATPLKLRTLLKLCPKILLLEKPYINIEPQFLHDPTENVHGFVIKKEISRYFGFES